jgi:hypothetical protein
MRTHRSKSVKKVIDDLNLRPSEKKSVKMRSTVVK